jgi:hypothetical protein
VNFQDSNMWLTDLAVDTVLNFIYASLMLTLPYLLDVNRIPKPLLNIPVIPLLFFRARCAYNPSVVYALWYIQSCSVLRNTEGFPLTQIVAPLVAAVFAGVLCNIYFPDDPTSWTRRKI